MFGKDESSRFPPGCYGGIGWACHVYASPGSGTGGGTIAIHREYTIPKGIEVGRF